MSAQHPAGSGGAAAYPDAVTSRRWVLHIDMDAFFASCEQLTRPTLRGRPVLVGGTGGRGVVAGASYEARVYGARSAMPMHQARRLVGVTAVVVPPRGAVYGVMSGRVFDALRARIPVLETLSFDEAFGEPDELAGASVRRVHEFCAELRALVRERTGLVASVGAGTGKQLAKIASGLAKPDGIRVVSPAEQQQLLAALPVRKLWGIGPVADAKLRSLGIETVGAFAALPEQEAVSILGSSVGAALHRLARGIDDRPVTERAEAKQISAETTVEHDIVTLDRLRLAIDEMAAAAHRRLARDGRAARTVVLKLKKSDMSIVTRSFTLPYATEDLATLTAAAQRSAIDPQDLGPIRLVGVGYAGLSDVRQESLFPDLDRMPELAAVGRADEAEIDEPVFTAAGRGAGPGPSAEADAVPVAVSPLVGAIAEGAAASGSGEARDGAPTQSAPHWQPGSDVRHPEFGHGWVQGAGHGRVTVRFETRSTGPGPARTFAADDPALSRADPLGSLD
ncbi:DNA polymerase IV [Nocardia cyriacigeorgica]|uniref:DNA polymerase IV n=1 Tax=Nocardia cyriacigeorgica (strain GUH-2) TaxID=1127134 RepID=H6RD29_NOCCG|nr:DNA polymerase IV [Nocardia cyriacigeorgica]CCF62673.1 DNA polymerase IV [Nocardia cyriacigeorgica GUH-2]